MALYPIDIPQLIGTSFSPVDGTEIERSISGRPRIRNYYSQTWREGEIVHECNQSQLDSLTTFYNDNRGIVFTFTYSADSVTYNCQFTSALFSTPILGGFYDVKVSIVEVV